VPDDGKLQSISQADEGERKTVRKEIPLFSSLAFEETVINAFVHNHWLDTFSFHKDEACPLL